MRQESKAAGRVPAPTQAIEPARRRRFGWRRILLRPVCGLGIVGDFEEGARLEAEETGDEDVGDFSDAGVVGIDVVVEKFAAVGDALFEFADAALQLEKVFVGLELGIIFGDGEQAAQSVGRC